MGLSELNKEVSNEEGLLALSKKIIKISADTIIVGLRFLDVALSRIVPTGKKGALLPYSDGRNLYYDARSLLKNCRQERGYCIRLMLHVLMHWVFSHPFSYAEIEDEKNREYFSLAADIAVEAVVMGMELSGAGMVNDDRRRERLRALKKNTHKLSAQAIYRYFLVNGISSDGEAELKELFVFDSHAAWISEEASISLKDWQKLSERIKTDVKTFSKGLSKSQELFENLEEATKERVDYGEVLRHFCVMGENIQVNDEEFDYIYYTYGLSEYKNMPLIEPLEYMDVKKIREFVIVLDTSASCRGKTVAAFLKKTVGILKSQDSFFSKINVHILQCDSQVQQDTKITEMSELDVFLKNGKLTGFGSTDYRPAFGYVDELIEKGEFTNLKGLIYFTDGYGTYPARMPQYDSMFVFMDEDEHRIAPPPWAMEVVLYEDMLA